MIPTKMSDWFLFFFKAGPNQLTHWSNDCNGHGRNENKTYRWPMISWMATIQLFSLFFVARWPFSLSFDFIRIVVRLSLSIRYAYPCLLWRDSLFGWCGRPAGGWSRAGLFCFFFLSFLFLRSASDAEWNPAHLIRDAFPILLFAQHVSRWTTQETHAHSLPSRKHAPLLKRTQHHVQWTLRQSAQLGSLLLQQCWLPLFRYSHFIFIYLFSYLYYFFFGVVWSSKVHLWPVWVTPSSQAITQRIISARP